MSDHPIEALMKTAMESIKEMVDVNTVVGNAVETPGGAVIIPVSRVACGFAAGGGEYETGDSKNGNGGGNAGNGGTHHNLNHLPFGGGSGAGVSVQPVGFLVVSNDQIRMLPVDGNMVIDRMIDVAPNIISQIQGMFKKDRPQQSSTQQPSVQSPVQMQQ